VEGTLAGAPVAKIKEWLVDTGATISAITKSNADDFDLTPVAVTAQATGAGAGIIMKSGLTMFFLVKDSFGTDVERQCNLDVGVKPDDSGSEVLGMDQVAHVGAKVHWDPRACDGDLKQ
jgi:carbon monoxide dehydrogenase subunit G